LIDIDAAPRSGDHHGRLAVEQAYGYMVHNAVKYGIITTVNAFAFLARENGGILKLTRLIPAVTTNPTVLKMLYYMSHLCALTPTLLETHPDGRSISIIRATPDSSTAPKVPAPSVAAIRSSSTLGPTPSFNSPRRSPRFQTDDSQNAPNEITKRVDSSSDLRFEIDIHTPGTWLGCKGYKGVLHTGETAFAKLWDGWKYSGQEADREAQIYMELSDLWGITVPKLIAHGGWGFCHIILLEFIEVFLFLNLMLMVGHHSIESRPEPYY
jgi:hypothetical protein